MKEVLTGLFAALIVTTSINVLMLTSYKGINTESEYLKIGKFKTAKTHNHRKPF